MKPRRLVKSGKHLTPGFSSYSRCDSLILTDGNRSVGMLFVYSTLGDIIGWGPNQYGQIGNGTKSQVKIPTKIDSAVSFRSIAVGDEHVLAIGSSKEHSGDQEHDQVYVWGSNSY